MTPHKSLEEQHLSVLLLFSPNIISKKILCAVFIIEKTYAARFTCSQVPSSII